MPQNMFGLLLLVWLGVSRVLGSPSVERSDANRFRSSRSGYPAALPFPTRAFDPEPRLFYEMNGAAPHQRPEGRFSEDVFYDYVADLKSPPPYEYPLRNFPQNPYAPNPTSRLPPLYHQPANHRQLLRRREVVDPSFYTHHHPHHVYRGEGGGEDPPRGYPTAVYPTYMREDSAGKNFYAPLPSAPTFSREFIPEEVHLPRGDRGRKAELPASSRRRLARMLIEQGLHHDEDHLVSESRQLYRHLIQKSLARRPMTGMVYGSRSTTTTTTTTPPPSESEEKLPFAEGSIEFETARKVLASAIKDVIESPSVLGTSIREAEEELRNSQQTFRNRLFAARTSRQENNEEESAEKGEETSPTELISESTTPDVTAVDEDKMEDPSPPIPLLEDPPLQSMEEERSREDDAKSVERGDASVPLPSLPAPPPPSSSTDTKNDVLQEERNRRDEGVLSSMLKPVVNGDL